MSVQPVFVLSLPRSGSTLVQRVMTAHAGVATASEPWVLLPLLGPTTQGMPLRGDWQRAEAAALGDFVATLPRGTADYDAVVRRAALELYASSAGPGAQWFVDKTPPYSFIADRLFDVFPEGRFLILWRHPLAVVASIVETFCRGRWRPDDYSATLFTGLAALISAAARHRERAVQVRYEDLLTEGPDAWRAMFAALGMPFDPLALERFGEVRLAGRMGDTVGAARYPRLSAEPVERWREVLSTPVRRDWSRRYLRWIGSERLAFMGYDLRAELAALDSGTSRGGIAATGRDGVEVVRSLARDVAKRHVVPGRGRGPSSWRLLLSS